MLLEGGETQDMEIWVYEMPCVCGEKLNIDPDDYHLLMGDQYFMRFRTEMYVYRAMTRQEMVESIDG